MTDAPLILTDEPAPAPMPFDPDEAVKTRSGVAPAKLRKLFDLHMRGEVDGEQHDWSQDSGRPRGATEDSALDLVNADDGVKAKT